MIRLYHNTQLLWRTKPEGKERNREEKERGGQPGRGCCLVFFFYWPQGGFCNYFNEEGVWEGMGWVWRLHSSDSSFICFVSNYPLQRSQQMSEYILGLFNTFKVKMAYKKILG